MIDKRAVYVYRMADSKRFTGVALLVEPYTDQNGARFIQYHDTVRGHRIEGKVTRETEDGFIFRSEGFSPGEWEFRVMTVEAFKRTYHKLVADGNIIAAKVHTTADLHEWYRHAYEHGYFD